MALKLHDWLDVVTNDPLLPEAILPSDYLRRQAWRWPQETPGSRATTVNAQPSILHDQTLSHMRQKFVSSLTAEGKSSPKRTLNGASEWRFLKPGCSINEFCS